MICVFQIIALAMNFALMYELFMPMTVFTSYEVNPRQPRLGYVPAAQSENEYIDGIVRQLESAPADVVETRPVIRQNQKIFV